MASYSSTALYAVGFDNGSMTVSAVSLNAATATDNELDQYFSDGDVISVTVDGATYQASYLGASKGGWIGILEADGVPFATAYFSTDTSLKTGDPILFIEGQFDTLNPPSDAVYFSKYLYLVEENDGVYTVTPQGDDLGVTAANFSGDQAFSPGETIKVTTSFGQTVETTYIGRSGNGWIGYTEESQNYFYFTNELTDPGEIQVEEEPFAVCFMAGTLIATPSGACAVEHLAIGDEVVTAAGDVRQVRWIGRQTMVTVFADRLRSLPVRIAAGALGDGLPVRDLDLSPDHALLIDGLLVQAGALVNGTAVTRMTGLPERFTYYHVELEGHALVLAEGVPAETFVDNVTRRRFDNWAEFEALYGSGPSLAELDLPRVKSARQLPRALRDRLQGMLAEVA